MIISFKKPVLYSVFFVQEIDQNGLADRKDSDKPIVCALSEDGKYPMNKEFRLYILRIYKYESESCSIENLKQFVEDVLAGKLEPYLKSEPIPTDDGDLKTLVAKNFKETVLDADKDALIEFVSLFILRHRHKK